jgi:hypothetical protein
MENNNSKRRSNKTALPDLLAALFDVMEDEDGDHYHVWHNI